MLYYHIFLVRRILYAASIILLENPYTVLLFNHVLFYGVLSYVIYYKPFEQKLDMFHAIINESCLCIVLTIVFFFNFDLSYDESAGLEAFCIFIIFLSLLLNYVIIVLKVVVGFRKRKAVIPKIEG